MPTSNYDLPLFEENTPPDLIGVVNNAFNTIDNALNTIQQAVTAMQAGKAPTSHATNATTYGVGTATNYGHVRISSDTSGTSADTALSQAGAHTMQSAIDALEAASVDTTPVSNLTTGDLSQLGITADGIVVNKTVSG